MSKLNRVARAAVLLGACGAAGCHAPPAKQWVKEDATVEEFQSAKAFCQSFVEREFNPYEDFSDPALGSIGVEQGINRRLAYRKLFEGCMADQGFSLGSAASGY